MVGGLIPAMLLMSRGGAVHRLVGLELASAVTVLLLMMLSVAFGQPQYFVVPLVLSLGRHPGVHPAARQAPVTSTPSSSARESRSRRTTGPRSSTMPGDSSRSRPRQNTDPRATRVSDAHEDNTFRVFRDPAGHTFCLIWG
jgi:hypothetical protein